MARASTEGELAALQNIVNAHVRTQLEAKPLFGPYVPRKMSRRERIALELRHRRTRLAIRIAPWIEDWDS